MKINKLVILHQDQLIVFIISTLCFIKTGRVMLFLMKHT